MCVQVSYVPDVGLGFHEVKVNSLQLSFPSKETDTEASGETEAIPIGEAAILDTGYARHFCLTRTSPPPSHPPFPFHSHTPLSPSYLLAILDTGYDCHFCSE